MGTLARSAFVLAPSGVNNEGYPSSAPANGPSEERIANTKPPKVYDAKNNHLHANPYPNVTGPGQPAGLCEAANETYVPGAVQTGNLPAADVATNREFTSREEGLFGEKYPSTTLKSLGLVKPKPQSKSKPKSKAKGKSS